MPTATSTDTPQLRELFRAAQAGDERSRERLLVSYAPLVKQIVGRLQLPAHLSRAELYSYGLEGLLHAIERYRPDGEHTSFVAFASPRIRGAVLDELRRQDWVPRTQRERERMLAAARARLLERLGRQPRPQELADALGLSLSELAELEADCARAQVRSLFAGPEQEGALRGDDARPELADPHAQAALEEVELAEEHSRLHAALAALSERERIVVTLYFYEELRLREIGEVLGVSESRACQLFQQALGRLRTALDYEELSTLLAA
jgi:RNA polymerase sigma factor for flagellar operon FliA